MSVADCSAGLTSTVAGIVPPSTLIAKVLLLLENGAVTVPSGSGVGMSTTSRTDQPLVLDGSAQIAALTPQAVSEPTLPPKFTPPSVAARKALIAPVPLVSSVGKVKFHHLKPIMGLPVASVPLGVLAEM